MRILLTVTIQPDLLSGATVEREWSRPGGSRRMLQERFRDEGQAVDAIVSAAKRMDAKGFRNRRRIGLCDASASSLSGTH